VPSEEKGKQSDKNKGKQNDPLRERLCESQRSMEKNMFRFRIKNSLGKKEWIDRGGNGCSRRAPCCFAEVPGISGRGPRN